LTGTLNNTVCHLMSNHVRSPSEVLYDLDIAITNDHLSSIPVRVRKARGRHLIVELISLALCFMNNGSHQAQARSEEHTWIDPFRRMPKPLIELRPNIWL
jgi:hypothetical protein